MSLHDLRRSYQLRELSRRNLARNPIEQFQQWFDELRQAELPDWFEVNAMVLSTIGTSQRVTSRVVLLKSIASDGLTFFTNYRSAKAKQLENNPRAALNFYWPMFERQVRIEGTVSKVASDISDAYFDARPMSSRLGAIVSPQSEVIADDEPLAARVEKLAAEFADKPIPRPEHWGGYQLIPELFEFWQGRPSRLHDRFRYTLASNAWTIDRLAP